MRTMQARTRAEQRRIDTACGYALGAYASVTLTWISLLVLPGLALFGFIMAGVAGFFGLLRGVLLPLRFWIIQAMTLAYLLVVAFDFGLRINNPPLALAGIGMLYTAALGYNLCHILRHDFARTVPDWLCAGCGYALLGLADHACPECGRPFDPDQVPTVGPTTQKKTPRAGVGPAKP